MLYQASVSEQTPSESYVTSDDEEAIRQTLEQHRHPITPVSSSHNLRAAAAAAQRRERVSADLADYIEQVCDPNTSLSFIG